MLKLNFMKKMKIKSVLFIVILSIFTLSQSCSKEELKLNEDYINVSDLWRYVNQKGICEDATKWINKEVKVKGYINTNNFNLCDIRNGTNIQICIPDSIYSIIIDKVNSSNESSMCYIKGILRENPYIIIGLLDDKPIKCSNIPAIYLYNIEDIYFK